MSNPVYPATNNSEAIELNISNANQFHNVLNGDIETTVPTYEGNGEIPSVAKALNEAAAYKSPLDWETTGEETDLLQPRVYEGNIYVPLFVPAQFSTEPDSQYWRLYSKIFDIPLGGQTFNGFCSFTWLPNATVYVYESGTTNPISGLTDENDDPLSNPFTTDSSGNIAFNAPDGLYDIRIQSGVIDRTIDTVLFFKSSNLSTSVGDTLIGTESGQNLRDELSRREIVFDSVADMQAATWLNTVNRRRVRTLGYYEPGDGGANNYEIVASGTGTDDGGSYIDLQGSGVQARGLFECGVVTPLHFGAGYAGIGSDSGLSAFAEFMRESGRLYAYKIFGQFEISVPCDIEVPTDSDIEWDADFLAQASMLYMLSISGKVASHSGFIRLAGTGTDAYYSTWGVDHGLVVAECQGAQLPFVSVHRCRGFGIIYDENGDIVPLASGKTYRNNTMLGVYRVHARDCGGYSADSSPTGSGTLRVVGTYSNPVQSGSSGSPNQKTFIDVTVAPDVITNTPVYAVIDDETYRVDDVTPDGNGGANISLYPFLQPWKTSGEIRYYWGGALHTTGPNGGPSNIGYIDAIRCATGITDTALYGVNVGSLVAQSCAVGIQAGQSQNSAAPTASVYADVYTENVYKDVVRLGGRSLRILDGKGAFKSQFEDGNRFETLVRRVADGDSDFYFRGVPDVFSARKTTLRNLDGLYSKLSGSYKPTSIELKPNQVINEIYFRNSFTLNAVASDESVYANTGLDQSELTVFGSGPGNAPTGSITINPPSGWAINDQAADTSVSLNSFGEPVRIIVFWEFATSKLYVNVVSRRAASSEPTSGYWHAGEVVYNSNPATGQPAYWQCTSGGSTPSFIDGPSI